MLAYCRIFFFFGTQIASAWFSPTHPTNQQQPTPPPAVGDWIQLRRIELGCFPDHPILCASVETPRSESKDCTIPRTVLSFCSPGALSQLAALDILRLATIMAPPTHDTPLKRKRTRLERTDSDGLLSFFRRKFYRDATPSLSDDDENNNDTEHEDEIDPPASDFDSRGLRRVTAMGLDEHANDVLLRVAQTTVATANVVFFPGDVQDFHCSM
jgi:hypothetical protein